VTSHTVECLRCGAPHLLVRAAGGRLDHGECPRCGYLGWTPARIVHEAPPPALVQLRRLRVV